MNIFDIRTIFVSYSITDAICALVMAFLWLQNRRRSPELGFWLANFIMQFFSLVLISLRGFVPDFISIVFANTIGVAGSIFLYIGMGRFVGKVHSQRFNYLLLVAFFIIHAYFTYIHPSLMGRNNNFSVVVLLICSQSAWLLFRRVDPRFRQDTSRVGFIFLAFAVVSLVRFLVGLVSPDANDLFQSGLFESLLILTYQMLYISLTFTLFLMVNHRLVAELGQDILERKLTEDILQARLRIIDFSQTHPLDDLLQNALDELCALAESPIGFFHFVEPDQRTLSLQAWSTHTDIEMFAVKGHGQLYNLDQASVWVDCVREKQPVIYNDNTNLPQAHPLIFREMVFPILRNQKTVAIISVGNKAYDYTETDVSNTSRLADLIWDITGRKKAEQALHENYSTLHNILESTDALIFSLNHQYAYTSFNSAHAAKMKQIYNQDIQIGGNLFEYMTVDTDRLTAKQSIDRALAGETVVEESFSGEELLSRLYFEISQAPIRTDTGEIFGVSIFAKDITARKQMELSLQHRLVELEIVNRFSNTVRSGKNGTELFYILLQELLDAVNSSDGCIILLDPKDNSLAKFASCGWFESAAGFSFNSAVGIVNRVFETNEPYISLDIQKDNLIVSQPGDFVQPWSSAAILPLRGENGMIGMLVVSFQLPRIITDNELRLLTIISQLGANAISRSRLHEQIRSFNLDLQEEIHQRVVVQKMLAAEKELLSTTLMSIADGVIVTDSDGFVMLLNHAAETITGYTFSDAIKKPVNNVFKLHSSFPSEMVSDVIGYLFELELAQKNHSDYRSPLIITKTGERILISGSITSLKSSEENIAGYVIVFQNVNEKQKADAQNVLSQKMQAIGQLAAGIAHEINTPIQYIGDNINFLGKAFSKYSETLLAYQRAVHAHFENPLTPDDLARLDDLSQQKKVSYYANEIPKAIQESLDGTERVRKIVLAMREFSHPSAKGKAFSDINHGIETTIVISRNEWKYFAELKTDLDNELPLVYSQIDEINQVILNMIVNAVQAIQEKLPPGSEQKGTILITTRKHENKVRISIQDTGSGMPADVRARIFDPFFTTKGIGKGTGQGLSMAHNIIVNKHQGLISVDSDPGQGTIFTIELPIDNSELEQK